MRTIRNPRAPITGMDQMGNKLFRLNIDPRGWKRKRQQWPPDGVFAQRAKEPFADVLDDVSNLKPSASNGIDNTDAVMHRSE